MDEFFLYGSFSLGSNGSEADSQVSPDHTVDNVTSSERSIVAEQPRYNRQMRIIAMTIIFAVAFGGNSVVLYKICSGKDKKRKINFLIAQLALADLCVSVLTLLSQIVWEFLEDEWLAGDVSCRIFKVFQVSGLIASSNIIAIIALERHHVIMNPLSSPLPTRCFAVLGWLLAFLLSVPQGFVFKAVYTKEGSRCCNVFGQLPRWQVQLYIIYSSVTVFFLPFCILTVAYSRILWIVWRKAKSSKALKQSNGACELQTTKKTLKLVATNSCIPRAKIKTLKMTVVVIILFIVCGLPYFVVEMKIAFGTITGLDEEVMAVLGIFVVTNSAVNPYVYIFFKTNNVFLRRLEKKICFCCCLHERRKPSFRKQLFPSSTPTHKQELSSTTTSEVEECSVLHRSLFLQPVAPDDRGLSAQCESCM